MASISGAATSGRLVVEEPASPISTQLVSSSVVGRLAGIGSVGVVSEAAGDRGIDGGRGGISITARDDFEERALRDVVFGDPDGDVAVSGSLEMEGGLGGISITPRWGFGFRQPPMTLPTQPATPVAELVLRTGSGFCLVIDPFGKVVDAGC